MDEDINGIKWATFYLMALSVFIGFLVDRLTVIGGMLIPYMFYQQQIDSNILGAILGGSVFFAGSSFFGGMLANQKGAKILKITLFVLTGIIIVSSVILIYCERQNIGILEGWLRR